MDGAFVEGAFVDTGAAMQIINLRCNLGLLKNYRNQVVRKKGEFTNPHIHQVACCIGPSNDVAWGVLRLRANL